MIGKYDPDVVQNLMPLIVNVLGKYFPIFYLVKLSPSLKVIVTLT